MKKTKRLLSLLTALTISASAFAGLVIPASAAETQIGTTYTFDETDDKVWEIGGSKQLTPAIVKDSTLNSKVLQFTGGGTGGRSSIANLPAAVTPEADKPVVKLEFDWSSSTTPSGCSTDIIPVDASGKKMFKINEHGANKISFNDKEIEGLTRGWYRVSAILDFETHSVLKLTLTKNGEDSPAATYTHVPFIESEASGISGFLIAGNRASGQTLAVNTNVDNVAAYAVTDTYYKVEINVKDSKGTAVDGATVTIDNATYTTGSDGKVVTKLADGSYEYTASKIGFVDEEGNDTATGTLVVNGEAKEENVTYSLKPYTPEVTTAEMSGGQKVVYAPTGDTPSTTTAFTVNVADQNETAMEAAGYTVEWEVYPKGTTTADANVTIADGVVSVTKNYQTASGDAAEFDVIAAVTDKNNAEKTVTAKSSITVTNKDILFYDMETSFTATGGKDVNYDIEEVAVPAGGLHITFTFFKGTYDNSKADTYGQLIFKNGDKTIFSMKDMNPSSDTPDLTLSAGGSDYVTLGATERNKEYSVDATIMGDMLLMDFNGTGYKVIELSEAPDKITSINASTSQTGGSGTGAINLVMSTKITVDKSGVNVVGDDEFAKITGKTVTRKYSAKALVPEEGDSFTWSVTQATGVSIDAQTGVLSVDDTATPGKVTVTATSGEKTGSLEVTIADIQEYTPEVNVPLTMGTGDTYKLSVGKIIDALGDDVTEYFTPTWSIDGVPSLDTDVTFNTTDKTGKAVAISAVKENGVLKSLSTQDVTITGASTVVTAEGGSTVMLWDSLAGMTPIADPQKAPDATIGEDIIAAVGAKSGLLKTYNDGDLTLNLVLAEGVAPIQYRVMVAKYSKIVDFAAGTTEVDISDLVTYDATTFSVVLDNGTVLTKTAADGKITLAADELGDAAKAEVIPNYKFNFSGIENTDYTPVEEVYEIGYGFEKEATPTTGTGTGIQSMGVDLDGNSFIVDLPDGRYDMTFYKANTNRTHIRVNEYMTVTEADFQDGDDGTVDPLAGPGVYTKLDVNVTGGIAKINAYNWDKGVPLMAAVEITKKSEAFQPRKTHIWIAGDSTVCIYRPSPTTDSFAAGTRRTGWGQLLQNYLSDDVIVDDFAHSGDWADNWYKNTFPSVIQHAERGDYLIIQFGINDRTRTPDQKVMAAALSNMIDECRAKGVIPVLQTPELCISQYGTQVVNEHDKPTGSGHAGYFEVNRTVAKDKNVLLIDLADISATMWATMGRTWVSRNYFLWNVAENKQLDAQHMSYNGAKLVASMVATEILDQKTAGKKGANGESFVNIPVNAKVQSDVTYTDASDNQQKTINRMAAEFKPSALSD